jgi:hypothetical protein
MSAKDKMLKQLSAVYVSRTATTSPASTTVATAVAVGGLTVSTVSATGIVVGDVVRIGQGDTAEIAIVTGVSGNDLTIADGGAAFAHPIGDAVVLQSVYDLGDVSDAGATVEFNGEVLDVVVSTRRLLLTTIDGYVAFNASWALPTFSLANIAVALGMPFASVRGSGTSGSWLQLITDGSDWMSEPEQSVIIVSQLMDGTTYREELWGSDFDYTGITFTLGRGVLTSLPMKCFSSSGGMASSAANPYTPLTTFRATKDKVFDAVSEVGLFVDTGAPAATTVASGGAINTAAVTLTSGTGLAIGDWLLFGTGENIEIHQIDSVNTGTGLVGLKTLFYRAQAAGAVVKKQTATPFAGVSREGVTVSTGGNINPLYVVTKRIQVGARPGTANTEMKMGITDIALTTICQVLGISTSALVSSNTRLNINTNIGSSSQINGVYVKGNLKDQTVAWVVGWGATSVIAQLQTIFSAQGQATMPFTAKPSSAIAFFNHP